MKLSVVCVHSITHLCSNSTQVVEAIQYIRTRNSHKRQLSAQRLESGSNYCRTEDELHTTNLRTDAAKSLDVLEAKATRYAKAEPDYLTSLITRGVIAKGVMARRRLLVTTVPVCFYCTVPNN